MKRIEEDRDKVCLFLLTNSSSSTLSTTNRHRTSIKGHAKKVGIDLISMILYRQHVGTSSW
jgi:hypothetical protein